MAGEDFEEHDAGEESQNLLLKHDDGDVPEALQLEHGAGDVPEDSQSKHDAGDVPEDLQPKHDDGDVPGDLQSKLDDGDVPENLQPLQKLGSDLDSGGDKEERWPGWPGENVFRILVPVQKVGGIIGRKGESIKKITEMTKARIKVLDDPLGSLERAVSSISSLSYIIYPQGKI